MDQTISLLEHYGYLLLFPLAIVEGPIITVVAGFLVTLGYMNIFLVYPIVLAGDFTGDTILYSIGRWGKNIIHKYGRYIGASEEKLAQAKKIFTEKHTKAVVSSKLFHGVGVAGLVAAGVLAIPFRRYIKVCILVALAQSAVFLFIGIVFGHAYLRIAKYLDLYALTIEIVVGFLLVSTIVYKISKR